MTIAEITSAIETYAPLALQEDYDNCGLQVGNRMTECTGALLCVDATEAIVDEAISRGCNLVISHHPLIFKGLKRLIGSTQVERTVMKALQNGVAIYSCHTAIDNATYGVSWEMAEMLGVENVEVLDPQSDKLLKLSVMVPNAHCDEVKAALFKAGAGKIGAYDCCSFSVEGKGSFRALDGANPFVGELGEVHYEPETRVDVLLPRWLKGKVEKALINAHPYEVPAYEFVAIENVSKLTGSGVVGDLKEPMSLRAFVEKVKHAFHSPIVRTNAYDDRMEVSKIAMCGGSGSFLMRNAIGAGALVFLTSDTRYHDFVDYKNDIIIVDIGHFESEQCTKNIFYRIIQEKFPNFALYYSDIEKNPINYL